MFNNDSLSEGVNQLIDNTQKQQLTIPDEVRTFLEGILKDGNITSSDEEMHEEMIKELFARFDNFMTSTIVENLKEEDMEEFIKMGEEKKSREEIEKFITEKIPNAQDVFSQAMINFRDMYLGNVAVKRAAPTDTTPPVQNPVGDEANTNQPN